jgi:hypothetical protein
MFFKGHLTIFKIIFFINDSDSGTWRLLRRNIKVPLVQISASRSFYFWRYTLWKIGFFTSPVIGLKQVSDKCYR